MMAIIYSILSTVLLLLVKAEKLQVDPKGYILYCPCMGRFGNQADHFLGALAFAKGLDRTLVLPPWVEYRTGQSKSVQVPFGTYFDVESLVEYHRVVTMEDFFAQLASEVWPKSQRISFCYTERPGEEAKSCNAKNGNPFGPFWDTFNVDFVGSKAYGPLHYDVHHTSVARDWNEQFPASKWRVLAFTGAPAPYPVQQENVGLHKFLKWNSHMDQQVEQFMRHTLPKGPFVGIHLRNGVDWSRACEHVTSSPLLFASAQCLGYRGEHGQATSELCMPPAEIIIRQLRRLVNQVKAKAIFVASDHDHMIHKLQDLFRRSEVTVYKLDNEDNPHLDLAILAKSNHFIGNCVSSFSAFVKRERDANGLPTSFWAFPTSKKPPVHTEL